MEVKFLLKGLNCPHCSAEIEKEVFDLNEVKSASVNLMNQNLLIETTNENVDDVSKMVQDIVHKHEPDVEVVLQQEKTNNADKPQEENSYKSTIIRLIAGGVIYGLSILCNAVFDLNTTLYLIILLVAYVILGGDVVLKAIKNIFKGKLFDENFLMSLSTLGAFVIGEYPEAVAVMLFYQIGELFQDYAVNRSRKSITNLMNIRPDSATVMKNGELLTLSPEEVNVDDIILVKPGEKIPLDGVVVKGNSMLDTTALTGESLPRNVEVGDSVLSGCINQAGVLEIKVTKKFGDSTVSKIIDLVENASARKAPAENFITTFARYYTPVVVIAAVILAVVPPLFFGGVWSEWIRRCFVFLVISCPCALVISIPLTFFGGIGAASKKGVLVKGSNYLEALNKLDTVVFDKTGTLTKGVFKVTEINPVNGYTQEDVLSIASLAECMSNHPIATSIINAYGKTIDQNEIEDYKELSGNGIEVKAKNSVIIAGNSRYFTSKNISFEECDKIGTKVYVAKNNEYVGCILISDEIKQDSKEAIKNLKALGVNKCVMLTGDSQKIGKVVAQELNLDEYYTDLLPQQKVEKLEELFEEKPNDKKLAFVGDGINDAPVLARADIGIAMGGLGSDAAIEAADVVLMTDEPSKLVSAIKVANSTKRIVMENIIFALGVKLILLVLGAFGVATMWEAIFGDVGVMILAVLNAMRMLKK
jgi:Cd2+/Zn2+-exporting ATPase